MGSKIDRSWYENEDVTEIAKALLGKRLCTRFDGQLTSGLIVETEAYSGTNDKACHANGQKMTKRNKVMFEAGGLAYIYLCYGIHHLFNVVTNVNGTADAVLIRALEPIDGIDVMLKRRKITKIDRRLTAGPGVLSQALGITTDAYGTALDGEKIWLEYGIKIAATDIVETTRIGVDYAEEDALKPWRYYIKENNWVSKYSQ